MKVTTLTNKAYDQSTIDTLSWLRFPLILGVILNHCNLPALIESWYGAPPTLPTWATLLFTQAYIYIFPASVPTLFFISGYFFFRGNHTYNKDFYIEKYKRRIHSLLIPYILWNAIALLLIWTRHSMQFHSNITEEASPSILNYLSGFWNFTYNEGFTANAPLWFMRDLMVVSICAPILHFILQKKYWIPTLSLMVIGFITNTATPICGLNPEAFLFFSIGATLAINKTDITHIPHPIGIASLFLYLPVSYFLLNSSEQLWSTIMAIASIFIKTIAAIYIVSTLFRKEVLSPTQKLTRNSFFLYAFHGIVIGPVIKLLYIQIDSNNPYVLSAIYFIAPTITITAAFFLRHLLLHYLPRLGKLLSGSR